MVLLAPADGYASELSTDDDLSSMGSWPRPTGQIVARPPEPSHLSPLEQSVVALSLFDPRGTADAPGWLSRVLGRLFGLRPPNRLASPRLEMLRRYSILARETGGCPEMDMVEQIRCSGFSDAKIREVNRLVARWDRASRAMILADGRHHHGA